MKYLRSREWWMDLAADITGGLLAAVGIYNFATNAGFPVAGISGIALIFYHLFGLPIGTVTILLNIPIALVCFRILGKHFFVRSLRTMLIFSVMMDVVAPLLPLYSGNRMLAAICSGVLSGLGYAIVYMRGSSTGGADFIILSLKAKKPHLSIGTITFALDVLVVALGGLFFGDADSVIYGFLITYILSMVVDKVMYGIDAGKVTLIVTDRGRQIAEKIEEYSGRGSTILHGTGSYSGEEKQVVMCACNNKQMYVIRKQIKTIDPRAFMVIMESNEVIGEGFKAD